MLPGVFITDADGNIGTVGASVEDVCGIIFDYSKQSSFSFAHKDEVLELTSPADLETYGITDNTYNEQGAITANGVLNGVPFYHIDQFFKRRGGSGRLFVLFADCSSNWDSIALLQRGAHGLIYQTAIWTEQELFALNQTPSVGDHYTIANEILLNIDNAGKEVANVMNAPMSILLYPNVSTVKLSSGVEESYATPAFNLMPDLKTNYRFVSVMLGESNDPKVIEIQDSLTSKTPVGAAGADLGTLANNTVPTCIGFVGGCDYSGLIPGIVFGFGTNKTKYETVPTTTLSDLNDKGYNFFMKYEGDENGIYRNFDHTCSDGDYRTIARNRTMGKVRRGVRAALLPKVNQTVLINPATGFMTSAAQTEFSNAVAAVLSAMVKAGDISAFSTPVVTQTASLLQTDSVYISFSVVPVGISSAIYVTEAMTMTA